MANKYTLDITGLERQLERVKKNIHLGVIEGLNSSESNEYLKNIMKFYIDEVVYQAYTPKKYERTYQLRDNVTTKLVGDTLFIYVDDTGMDKPNGQWSYPHRVILGDAYYPYDYPVEGAGFMSPRDWRYVTKDELVNHSNQSGILLSIIKKYAQRRI